MLTPKEFLAQECSNVGKLLRDALRFDYGARGSETFFEQCNTQLNFVRSNLQHIDDSNADNLAEIAGHISQLSQLIAKIERSHIGEFSWAFGDAFRRHAELICSDSVDQEEQPDSEASEEATAADIKSPLFFIIADGGISAYSMRPEQSLLGVSNRRIFTIAVPRSLRHHVLLHSILGHEIGHAAQNVPERKRFIEGNIIPLLRAKSALATPVKIRELQLPPPINRLTDGELMAVTRDWLTEIACDLIGLNFMGPSFFGAARSLLGAIDSEGSAYGAKHPPNAWRYEALRRAYKTAGWDETPADSSPRMKNAHERMTTNLYLYDPNTASANRVFDDGVIEDATKRIADFLDAYSEPLRYVPPNARDLEELVTSICRARPPLGQRTEAGAWEFSKIDYRHILHAGWLAMAAGMDPEIGVEEEKRFFYINRLCEQAILQREALVAIRENNASSQS